MSIPNSRQTSLLITLSIVGLMGYGLYSQYYLYLEPCPLCMTQRFFYCLIGAIALIAAISNPTGLGRRLYGVLLALAAAGGIAAAGRQVWLQHLPPEQVPACGPSLEYMLETLPFSETLRALVMGDGNCAEVVWSFLGFSMGEWSLAWFLGFAGLAVWQGLRRD